MNGPKDDLTKYEFGYLKPLYYIKGGKWHCKCKCGNELDVDTRNLKSGHSKSCGCLKKENGKDKVYDMSNYEDENIKVLSRSGSDSQGIALWNCLCKHCGHIFITRGSSIRAGYIKSCGCVHSQNEQIISKLLDDNNIEYATQYTFPDLLGTNGGNLRFDFAVFDNNHKLSHLIEYNGSQHYIKTEDKWGEQFEQRKIHDQLKLDYCKKNNIKLIIIKYDQKYTIEDLSYKPVETISSEMESRVIIDT